MKKKNIFILISVIAIALFVLAWTIGYSLLSDRVDDATRNGFVNEAQAFLANDDTFLTNYGEIISMTSEDDMPHKNQEAEQTEYYMDFKCTTNRGEFLIRVYHVWNDGWSFRYDELVK